MEQKEFKIGACYKNTKCDPNSDTFRGVKYFLYLGENTFSPICDGEYAINIKLEYDTYKDFVEVTNEEAFRDVNGVNLNKNEIGKSVCDWVLEEWGKENLVYADIEGLKSVKFEEFIKQPLDGMLYDINRDAATILTFVNDPKWVNDFALTKLLEYYYNKCKEYEKTLSKSNKQ